MRTILLSTLMMMFLITTTDAEQRLYMIQSIYCTFPPRVYPDAGLPGIVKLRVTAEGETLWNGNPVDKKTPSKYLSVVANGYPQQIINVNPDPDTKFSAIEPVIFQIQRSGIHRMWIGQLVRELSGSLPAK